MAQFQEQELFKGAAQRQGFAPVQEGDITPYLRENMATVDANFARLAQAKQQELNNKLRRQQQTLKTLGEFSSTALEFAKTQATAYINNQYVEGTAKMRAQMDHGITPEVRAEYEAADAARLEGERAAEPVVTEVLKNNPTQESLNFIKSLPQYQRVAATKYYLQQKGKEYLPALEAFTQNSTFLLTAPDGSKFFPKDAGDDPVKGQILLSAFHRIFMTDNVGISKDEFEPHPVLLSDLLYKQMDQADAQYINRVRTNKTINDSLALQQSARQDYEINNDISLFISRNRGLYNPKTGKPMTYREARMLAYEVDLSRYANGEKDVFDKYREQKVDPSIAKNKTFYEQFKNEFTDIGGINDKIRTIDSEELKQDDAERRVQLRNVEQEVHQYAATADADDIDDPEFYIRLRQRLRPLYGDLGSDAIVDRLEKTYRPDLLRDEQMEPMIKDKAGRLELNDEFLDQYQVSANLRRKYQNEIAASNKLRSASVKTDQDAVKNAIRSVAKRTPDGTTSPMATLIEADLVNMYNALRKQKIEVESLSPEEASKQASIETIAFFDKESNFGGRYYQDPYEGAEYTNFKKYLGIQGQAARNISKRYYDLKEKIIKDGGIIPSIKDGSLFSKSHLERISTVIERDPFLTSIDQKDPLYVPLTHAKALIKETNPGLSLYKVLKQAYDAVEGMDAPPVIEQIQPALDQLSPKQTRFLNNILNGTTTSYEITRNVMPIGQMPLRPGKEYASSMTGMGGLRALTRSGEGGYTSMFPSESYPQLTNMTIRQVVEFQKQKLQDGRQSAAVGAYQILYPEKAAKMAGLSLDDKFTPQNQDMMFDALITQKRPKVGAYLSGQSNNLEAALDELAMEFASFEYRGGTSYYNDGLNKASISRTKAAAALRSAREEMMAGGNN